MAKKNESPVAIFIDGVILTTFLVSVVAFVLYYSNIYHNGTILWVGIVAFMIMYHLGLRIFFGNITSKLVISYKNRFFKPLFFEASLYKLLRVRKWKEKALTYDPDAFSPKKHSWEEIANTMSKSEVDHWINEVISVVSILFSLLWGEFYIFLITAILAMLFDAQFILIQRYNRPLVIKHMEKKAKLLEKRAKKSTC
ncbi:MAG: hypothetical protein IJ323_07320 [Clostridia bacterium]|nr:hypothetical protein [Clostridia bacterium]